MQQIKTNIASTLVAKKHNCFYATVHANETLHHYFQVRDRDTLHVCISASGALVNTVTEFKGVRITDKQFREALDRALGILKLPLNLTQN